MARIYIPKSAVEGRRFSRAYEDSVVYWAEQEDIARNGGDHAIHYIPSSIVCPRNMYYRKVNKPRIKDRSHIQINIAKSGEYAHLRIQENIKKMYDYNGVWQFIDVAEYVKNNDLNLDIVDIKQHEVKLYSPEYDISFLCDGILYNTKLDEYYILEIKTETMAKFYKHDEIREEHIDQAITYAMLFNIKNVLYLYEGRDFCQIKVIPYTVTDSEIDQRIIRKISYVNSCIEKDELPDVDYKIESVCKWCPYAKYCKKDEK